MRSLLVEATRLVELERLGLDMKRRRPVELPLVLVSTGAVAARLAPRRGCGLGSRPCLPWTLVDASRMAVVPLAVKPPPWPLLLGAEATSRGVRAPSEVGVPEGGATSPLFLRIDLSDFKLGTGDSGRRWVDDGGRCGTLVEETAVVALEPPLVVVGKSENG